MTDLVVFVAIVGIVAGAGIALGMIVARRIDRFMAPEQEPVPEPGGDAPAPAGRPSVGPEEEQQP